MTDNVFEGMYFKIPEAERRAALIDFVAFELPGCRFNSMDIPDASVAVRLADNIKRQVSPNAGRLAVAEGIVDACGWKMSYRHYGEGETTQANLSPLHEGGFAVTINLNLVTDDESTARKIGHEIGHSFFYTHETKPPERVSARIGRARSFTRTKRNRRSG
jgi:hypothetical protein